MKCRAENCEREGHPLYNGLCEDCWASIQEHFKTGGSLKSKQIIKELRSRKQKGENYVG